MADSNGGLQGGDQESILSESADSGAVREEFHDYWQSALKTFGVGNESMLLKVDAEDGFVVADRDEIVGWLTKYGSQCFPKHNINSDSDCMCDSMLEVGAGIGRLTGLLTQLCKQIIAVDFIEEYITRNRQNHQRPERPGDDFICADATKLEFPANSFDFIVWNWLLMYLSEEEMKKFVVRCCRWLKVGGLLFGRESCGEPSCKNHIRTWAPKGNPTEYRPASVYTWLLTDFMEEQGIKVEVLFKERRVTVYTDRIGTESQQCWLIRRVA